MNKEFIPYEQALALKELGFDEPCFGWFRTTLLPSNFTKYFLETELSLNEEFTDLINSNFTGDACSAPLYQQTFRWFREKYELLGFIEPANGYEDKSLFAFYICDDEQNIVDDSHSYSKDSSLHFKTYEEAELECLKKLIEIEGGQDES
jgi:hypothetical protein